MIRFLNSEELFERSSARDRRAISETLNALYLQPGIIPRGDSKAKRFNYSEHHSRPRAPTPIGFIGLVYFVTLSDFEPPFYLADRRKSTLSKEPGLNRISTLKGDSEGQRGFITRAGSWKFLLKSNALHCHMRHPVLETDENYFYYSRGPD